MSPITNDTLAVAVNKMTFNLRGDRYRRDNRSAPYPLPRDVYLRSSCSNCPEEEFKDLFINDFVLAQKRVARRKLHNLEMSKMSRALLWRGVQVRYPDDG